jgi:tetratricopeptide (TPR) repeat protein
MDARPSAFRLNGIIRVGLVVGLACTVPLPRVVQVASFLAIAAAGVVVMRPDPFLALTGGPNSTAGRELELADRAIDELTAAASHGDTNARESLADALEHKGDALQQLGRFEDALSVWTNLLRVGRDATEAPGYAEARALLGQAYALSRLGRHEEESGVLGRIEASFDDDRRERIRRIVDSAVYNEAVAWIRIERPTEAIAVYDRLIGRLDRDSASASDGLLSETLVNKAVAAQGVGDLDMSLDAVARVVTKFGDSDDAAIRKQVAIALVLRGNALTLRGDPGGALEAYEEVERRFSRTGPEAEVADSLVEKAALLAKMGRQGDAVRVCDQMLKRFGSSPDPTLRRYAEQVRQIRRACE